MKKMFRPGNNSRRAVKGDFHYYNLCIQYIETNLLKNCYMGELQIKKQSKKYDAVIVGSGAGGGMAAYVMAKAGLKVCLLEAGPMFDPAKHSSQMKNAWESPRRGA